MQLNQIICDNFKKLDILKDSIDLIFTDPPYNKDGISLYEDVAKLGAKILKPGGFLIVYASDYWLAETLPKMLNYLNYYYLYHKINTRGNASIFPKRIFAGGKSILLFSKGISKALQWTNNVIKINDICKDHRNDNWEQSVNDAKIFIDAYCPENGIVVDPMCGSGTTCVAAKMLNRNYIGIDISEEYCNISRERLMDI